MEQREGWTECGHQRQLIWTNIDQNVFFMVPKLFHHPEYFLSSPVWINILFSVGVF